MERRDFLRRAGTAAAATGAAALLGAAAGCGSPAPQRRGTGSTTSSTVAPPDWAALAATLSGTLVVPGDAAFSGDATLYNQAVTAAVPAAIAYCANASDVQRCVAYAREHDVLLAARSGGHSYAGYSSCTGLVVDVSSLNRVSVGEGSTQATVGAGTQLLPLYSQLGAAGVLLPGGSCPTVGIAGLALGGGIGVFGRAYGLTCDSIASLSVVTADGTLRTCTPSQHSDLYWASRGGGGGNFGVATSFTFNVHPIPAVTLFTLEWPWGAAAGVLESWLGWTSGTPGELWSNCQLAGNGSADGGGLVKVTGVYAGTPAACAAALAPLESAVGDATTDRFVGPEDYLRAMLIEAGCEGDTVGECNLPSRSPTGVLGRSAFIAKSSFVNAPLPASGVAALVGAVEHVGSEVGGAGGGMVFDGYGGAISQVRAADTAFVHRSAIACAQYSINFGASPGPALRAAAEAWLQSTEALFAPYAAGSYQNYIDPGLTDWASAYYGSNLPRLRQVKGLYDPDDLFRFAQSIPLPD